MTVAAVGFDAGGWRPLYLLPEVVDAEIVEEMHRHVMKGGFWLVHDHSEGLAPHGHSYVGMFQGESGCGPESWRSLATEETSGA